MNTRLNIRLNNSGASMIETMTAFAIFGIMVISIYPTFTEIQKIGKNTNIRRLCQQIVSTKLESYKSGYPVDLNTSYIPLTWPDTPANEVQLNALSLESYSDDSMGTLNSATPTRVLSGFAFAKVRYNHFYPESCVGESLATITSGLPQFRYLGIRECIGGPKGVPPMAWKDTTIPAPVNPCANSQIDMKISRELQGFKLYVKLELETPWRYGDNGTQTTLLPPASSPPDLIQRLHDRCPNFGNPPAGVTSSYDFSGQSDAIKVTVTGVIDYKSVGTPPLTSIGGVTNPFELTCQSSAVITPYRYPARYMITNQSKIYSIHGTAWNKSTETLAATNMVFRNVYQGGANTDVAGTAAKSKLSSNAILSFSVHPRDTSIWVLRAGQLSRYSNCFGTPVNCTVGVDDAANASGGFPDQSTWGPLTGAWPQYQSWNVPTGITSIGVDYRTGKVFGFAKSQSGGLILELTNGASVPGPATPGSPLGKCGAVDCTPTPIEGGNGAGGAGNNTFRGEVKSRVVDCLDDAGEKVLCTIGNTAPAPDGSTTGIPNPLAVKAEFPRPYFTSLPSRVGTFFMSPSGDAAFVTDNTVSMALGEEVYSSSVYRVTDKTLSIPIMTLPFYVTGFSM
ncbi:MAG: hypothetical protein KA715_14105 [Xanthomonadaceae bacterium]|nr:hypothetical protein [Xanthomonadaceae bacterium]